MPTTNRVSLTIEGPYFFSARDEDVFFDWLNSIPAVRDVGGSGTELGIGFTSRRISQRDLRELVALFHRYGIDKRGLRLFDSPRHVWFRNPGAFWYADVFRGD